MREDEKKLAMFLLTHVTDQGHCVALFDEEGLVLKSPNPKHFESELGASEVQQVLIYCDYGLDEETDQLGTVSLVFGNEPGVLLSDYGSSTRHKAYFDNLLKPVFEYATTLEE